MNISHKSKTDPKFLFWSLIVLIMLLMQITLSICLILVSVLLHRWFGIFVKLGGYAGSLIIPSYVAAFTSVTAIGRRFGFVEPRRTETLRRTPGPLPAAPFEELDLRTPNALGRQLCIACAVVGGLIVVLALVSGPTNHTRIYAFAASGVFFALSLLILWFGKSDRFNLVARIDRNGVTASQGLRMRSAAWCDIEAVEILALPGAPGGPITKMYTLFGRTAKKLFVFNLLFVPPAEQEAFECVLREAFEAQSTVSEITV